MELKIPSNVRKVKAASDTILDSLNGKELDDGFLYDIRLACEEAIINAIKYGNKSDDGKEVLINFEVRTDAIVISIEDQGEGFDYANLPDPRHVKNLLRTGGRGLFLIRKVMDEVEFNEKGNKITMTKYFAKT
ncbi:MAG: ATP-binding protein [Candidatus Omnitrophica bacterium]|nr:ATP-binding protein [Candidatus Omnitrophota bacterium]